MITLLLYASVSMFYLKAANVPLDAQQNIVYVVRMERIAKLGVGVGTVIIIHKRRRERILKMSWQQLQLMKT